jgi:anti-sigma regulatory factor (Ser/Thr protein kinase)
MNDTMATWSLQASAYLSEVAPAAPASVSWARQLLGDFAVAAGLTGQRLEDVRLAISEAVTNAVAYAYDGAAGQIQVIAAVVEDELWLVIADDGNGMHARPSEARGLGGGGGQVAQLSAARTLHARASGGVEVRMRFDLGPGDHGDASRAGR